VTDACPWCGGPLRPNGALNDWRGVAVVCPNGHAWDVAGYSQSLSGGPVFELGGMLYPAPILPEPEEQGEPMFTEKVVGYRSWRFDSDRLKAIAWEEYWVPGVNTAQCHLTRGDRGRRWARLANHNPEHVPSHDCQCGLYAYHRPVNVIPGGAIEGITGAVTAWGKMEVHPTGFRAQYAEIVALVSRNKTIAETRRAARRYRVPVVYSKDELEAVALEHGSSLPSSALPLPQVRSGHESDTLVAVRPFGGVWKCRCALCHVMVLVPETDLATKTARCPYCF
jgi:hypothetical protein